MPEKTRAATGLDRGATEIDRGATGMRVAVCELPDGVVAGDAAWRGLSSRLEAQKADLCVLNEMPFGPWVAASATVNPTLAAASVRAHAAAIDALHALPCDVLAAHPVDVDGRLANEAFLASDGATRFVHQKHYFPEEPGYFERRWFTTTRRGFDVVQHGALRIGVLLCTELMFTEWARHYRRQGAHVIAVPRASGVAYDHWHAAARMAAIVSGCYVMSSNRVSSTRDADALGCGADVRDADALGCGADVRDADAPGCGAGAGEQDAQVFGGRGFAYAPGGALLGETSTDAPVLTVTIDLDRVAAAQRAYPCNVPEIDSSCKVPEIDTSCNVPEIDSPCKVREIDAVLDRLMRP